LLSQAAGALARLDRTVHEPARLAILAVLAVVEEADFVFVQQRAGLTAGNLATHLARLEEAGMVRVTKTFVDRRPCTLLALTDGGRAALDDWRGSVGRLLDLLP
jgi:DNA-binding MarR family transcriptional regulator